MTPTPLVIIGCGGFGREVKSIVDAANSEDQSYELIGYVDDSPSDQNRAALDRLGMPLLGTIGWLDEQTDVAGVIGISSPVVRTTLDKRWPRRSWATLVHPDTTIGADVTVQPGTVIAAGSRISTAVSIGRHSHLDQNVTVGHDCALGDYIRLNPQACVSGSVTLGTGATVGANATILQGLSIGARAVIGAGAVVVHSVQPDKTVKGVPAR